MNEIEFHIKQHQSSMSLQMTNLNFDRYELPVPITVRTESSAHIMNTNASALAMFAANNMTTLESDYNLSMAQNELPEYVKILAGVFYFISMFLGIGGNMLVLLVVMYYQRMRTVTNFFIFNLAISDLIFALLCIPITYLTAYILQYWPFSSFLCVFFNYMQNVSVTLTVYTLVWITFDKYWAVVKPLKLRMTITMCKVLIAVSWLFSFVISLPIAIVTKLFNGLGEQISGSDSDGGSDQQLLNQTSLTNSTSKNQPEHLSRPNCGEIWPQNPVFNAHSYNIFLFFVQYFIPLILLTFCYARIGIVLRRTKAPGESIQNRDARMLQSKQKLIKMCFLMVLTFMVSWAPMQILTVYRFYDEKIGESSYYGIIFFVCHIIAVSRSFICPIIYTWTNLRFRAGFKYLLCFCYYQSEKKYSADHNFQSSEILRMNASFRNESIRTFGNNRRSIHRHSSYTNCSFRSRIENRPFFNNHHHHNSLLPSDLNSSNVNMSNNSGGSSNHHAAVGRNVKSRVSTDFSTTRGGSGNTFRLQEKKTNKSHRECCRSKSSTAICKELIRPEFANI